MNNSRDSYPYSTTYVQELLGKEFVDPDDETVPNYPEPTSDS